jgi:hypothetical protein
MSSSSLDDLIKLSDQAEKGQGPTADQRRRPYAGDAIVVEAGSCPSFWVHENECRSFNSVTFDKATLLIGPAANQPATLRLQYRDERVVIVGSVEALRAIVKHIHRGDLEEVFARDGIDEITVFTVPASDG